MSGICPRQPSVSCSIKPNCLAYVKALQICVEIMRIFLLPISARRTLIYCERVQHELNKSQPSIADRIVNKANQTWVCELVRTSHRIAFANVTKGRMGGEGDRLAEATDSLWKRLRLF